MCSSFVCGPQKLQTGSCSLVWALWQCTRLRTHHLQPSPAFEQVEYTVGFSAFCFFTVWRKWKGLIHTGPHLHITQQCPLCISPVFGVVTDIQFLIVHCERRTFQRTISPILSLTCVCRLFSEAMFWMPPPSESRWVAVQVDRPFLLLIPPYLKNLHLKDSWWNSYQVPLPPPKKNFLVFLV